MKALAHLIGSVVYVGHMRPAPGTWGSLAAYPLGFLVWWVGGVWLFALAIPVAFLKGWWATKVYTEGRGDHDPSEIVIDEVVGQWIALLPVVIGVHMTGASLWALWPGLIAAFVLFRLFDITKPLIVGTFDRMNTPLGVMADDVAAGIMAALGVVALAGLAHGVMAL